MANAQAEKLKALGLHHGEKAAVAIAGAVCLLLIYWAVSMPTIQTTPEEVADNAKRAQTNLSRSQSRDDILETLENAGFKNPDYEKVVDVQAKTKIDVAAYTPKRPWIIPEPGAGLIRSQPELLAVTDLEAFPGRGGFLVFQLDEKGQRIPEDPEKLKKPDDAVKKRRGKKKKRRAGGGSMAMMGSSSGGGSGMAGMPGMPGAPRKDSAEAKKELERKARQLKASLSGRSNPRPDADKSKDDALAGQPDAPSKEITKGFRWVALTGVLDHKKMRENWSAALKFDTAAPHYRQLNVQHQYLQADDTWSDWEDVNIEQNHAIVWNLPEEEEELTPDDVRISALVDPLPFLKAGYLQGVHVASLVPKEKLEEPKTATAAGGMMGGDMMGSGMMPSSAGMMGGMMGSEMSMGGDMMGSGMMGGMMGGMGGPDAQDFEKSAAPTLMIRSLDFTVEPDTTYKFRVQVVVYNPNFKRDDVAPGVDTKSEELKGPWSEPSNAVTMPPDVAAYALKKTPSGQGAKRTDRVSFQIIKWNPEDGVTLTKLHDAGPGEIIGDHYSVAIPTSDGKKAENKNIDFNSKELVVDTAGGYQPIAPVGAVGAPLDVPALSMMLRPDGSLMVRNEIFDYPDPVRKDIDENYKREVKESGKTRESSMGSMMGSGMGMYGSSGRR